MPTIGPMTPTAHTPQNPLRIVILAAGKGRRMNSDRPKVMHPLAGAPMISWLLETVEELRPERVIVVVGPDMRELENIVSPHPCAVQKNQSGTADALKSALPLLKNFTGDVLVVLADTPLVTAATLQNLIAARQGAGVSVLGTVMKNPEGYGRLLTRDDGTLERIAEDRDARPEEKKITLVNAGALCVDGAKLGGWLEKISNKNAQGEYYLTDLPQIAAAEGAAAKVYVTSDPEEVQGCNTRANLAALESAAQIRLRQKLMDAGVTLLAPSTVYLQRDTRIAPDVTVEPNVVFGPGVSVERGARIKSFSHIEGAKIDEGAVVGPFARLRPGAEIGAQARVGNFVEIKKSRIGARSKINHLAYIGDTVMGADVNVGAGAITANYNGFAKHQTVIEDKAMIGSNAVLVAPVSVGEGAMVAAGSTVTKDIPKDALFITRARAKIRKSWAAAYRKRKKKSDSS